MACWILLCLEAANQSINDLSFCLARERSQGDRSYDGIVRSVQPVQQRRPVSRTPQRLNSGVLDHWIGRAEVCLEPIGCLAPVQSPQRNYDLGLNPWVLVAAQIREA